jgi:hypothetical protein
VDGVTRTVWDGDSIVHEIRAPAGAMETVTALPALGGTRDGALRRDGYLAVRGTRNAS